MKKLVMILFSVFCLVGCQKEIGDECSMDMDCSDDGDRTCDHSQPGGYCVVITCTPDECPSEASCVEFITPSPEFQNSTTDTEETYTEALYTQLAPNRTRTYCLKKCKKNSDCRGGYHCALEIELEDTLNGFIIDSTFSGLGACVPN